MELCALRKFFNKDFNLIGFGLYLKQYKGNVVRLQRKMADKIEANRVLPGSTRSFVFKSRHAVIGRLNYCYQRSGSVISITSLGVVLAYNRRKYTMWLKILHKKIEIVKGG